MIRIHPARRSPRLVASVRIKTRRSHAAILLAKTPRVVMVSRLTTTVATRNFNARSMQDLVLNANPVKAVTIKTLCRHHTRVTQRIAPTAMVKMFRSRTNLDCAVVATQPNNIRSSIVRIGLAARWFPAIATPIQSLPSTPREGCTRTGDRTDETTNGQRDQSSSKVASGRRTHSTAVVGGVLEKSPKQPSPEKKPRQHDKIVEGKPPSDMPDRAVIVVGLPANTGQLPAPCMPAKPIQLSAAAQVSPLFSFFLFFLMQIS